MLYYAFLYITFCTNMPVYNSLYYTIYYINSCTFLMVPA